MATDKLMTYDQGQSIITDLELIATRIAAINQNIQLTSDKVTQMTGYSEPANTGAISASNTLNEAIGKLERKADNNQNNILSKIGASDYATQTTGGTVRVWTTTSGGETTLHIANEAPTP